MKKRDPLALLLKRYAIEGRENTFDAEAVWLRAHGVTILGADLGDEAQVRPQGSEPLPRIPDDTLAALLQEAIQSPELNFPNFTYANTAAWLAARGVQVRPQGEAPPGDAVIAARIAELNEIQLDHIRRAFDVEWHKVGSGYSEAYEALRCALREVLGLRGGEAPHE